LKARTLTVVAAVAVPATAAPTASAREFEGTVVAVNRDARAFRLRDKGRSVHIRITRRW
jgi:hypothetical protein